MTTLTESINQIISLSEDDIIAIEKAYTTVKISKGELFIEQGKVCNQVAFVVSGKLRNFYFDEAGNEVTCYFVTPNNFVSAFSSFLTNAPTHENISTLEDTVLRTITKKDLDALCELVQKMQIFRRVIVENLFITMEKRIMMLQSQSAHERYEKMIKENPEILLSVPLQYTASFLGITPQHLSRLRKELA
ncbi:MAG: Crp/Fnr family transcriptional regulator, partial [Bacteroidota bacterium]